MIGNTTNTIGKTIRWQRITARLTLKELAVKSGVSVSYLGRIERGKCFPSASMLKKIARPLGFEEGELFALAAFLSLTPAGDTKEESGHIASRLDPYVARVLAQEPVKMQRAALGILITLKGIAKSISKRK